MSDKKPKRNQVHAACMQCKKAHAACSHTRPCDRCIRTNQPDACTDGPRVKRLKDNNKSSTAGQPSPPETPIQDNGVFMPSSFVEAVNSDVGINLTDSHDLSYLLMDAPAAALELSNDFIPVFGDTHSPIQQPSPSDTSLPTTPELLNNPPYLPQTAPTANFANLPYLPQTATTTIPQTTTIFQPIPQTIPQATTIPQTIHQTISQPTTIPQHNTTEHIPAYLQPTSNSSMENTISTLGGGVDITQQLLHYVRRMENTIDGLKKEVEVLRQEVATVKTQKSTDTSTPTTTPTTTPTPTPPPAAPPAPIVRMVGGKTGFGHAVWSIPDLYLVQYNEDFATLLGCQFLPFQPYHFTNLFKLATGPSDDCPAALCASMERLKMSGNAEDFIKVCDNVRGEVGSVKRKMRRYTGEIFTCAITAQILPEKNIIVTFMYEA